MLDPSLSKQLRDWTLFPVLLLVALAGEALAQRGPSRVEVMPVVESAVSPTIRLVGTVRPQLRVSLASQVSGLVVAMEVEVGDFVPAGRPLARLRDEPRRLALAEVEARVAELKAALSVRNAELKKAEFEKQRTERLWKIDRSSEKERHDSIADFEAASGRVRQAEFAVSVAEAISSRLADELAQTVIRSPFDAHVVARHAEVGGWVDEGGSIVDLVDLSTVRVRVNVPEGYIQFNKVGVDVPVSVESQGRDYNGRIGRVIPDAHEQARTFPVDVDIPNADFSLKPGMFVRAAVPMGVAAKRLLVPKDAIVRRGPVPMVYVVRQIDKQSMAEPVPVRISAEVLDLVAISETTLAAGDRVVVRGNEFLRGPGPVIAMPSMAGRSSPGANADGNPPNTNSRRPVSSNTSAAATPD